MYTKDDVIDFMAWSYTPEARKVFAGQFNVSIVKEFEYWEKNVRAAPPQEPKPEIVNSVIDELSGKVEPTSVLTSIILCHWPKERINKFALHLLGDKCQECGEKPVEIVESDNFCDYCKIECDVRSDRSNPVISCRKFQGSRMSSVAKGKDRNTGLAVTLMNCIEKLESSSMGVEKFCMEINKIADEWRKGRDVAPNVSVG